MFALVKTTLATKTELTRDGLSKMGVLNKGYSIISGNPTQGHKKKRLESGAQVINSYFVPFLSSSWVLLSLLTLSQHLSSFLTSSSPPCLFIPSLFHPLPVFVLVSLFHLICLILSPVAQWLLGSSHARTWMSSVPLL